MATVVISPSNVANFLDGGGGHFWVYLQYAHGLRQLGCEVYWLECLAGSGSPDRDAAVVAAFARLMERYGLGRNFIVYAGGAPAEYLAPARAEAEAVFRRADLLLNFRYAIDPGLLAGFRRTALVDIDPGLLQFWISA